MSYHVLLLMDNWMPNLTTMFFCLFCVLQGLSIRQIRFRFDGQPINETDTPAQVGESWTPKYDKLY